MTSDFAFTVTAQLLAFNLFLHGWELFILSGRDSFKKIWSYQNLKIDLEKGLPLKNSVVEILFSATSFKIVIVIQILSAAVSLYQPQFLLFVFLFFTHLIICIRFRGSFNGGSDMMTFVLLFGVLIGFSVDYPKPHLAGLAFITINALYSYFKAGLSKITQPEWRDGSALAAFLKRSLLKDIRKLGLKPESRKSLCRILSWGVLAFELAAPLLIFYPKTATAYFVAAIFFHFSIYLSFGLNRFFMIWLTAWPATLFSLGLVAR